MSTIVDVCKLAGVSKTTVSRVINGTGQVKKSTQDAVKAAMEQLGYRPNTLAQALARNETNSIGLVISDYEGVYFGALLKQASASAEQSHKELIITDGHRKIACITGPLNTPTSQARFAAYQDTLKQYAIPFNPNLVKNAKYGLQDGYDACQELIENNIPFSTLLAFNDEMALGALKALTDAGISVPEQVSIAGIDNKPITQFSHPSISTIDLPVRKQQTMRSKSHSNWRQEKPVH